MNVKDQFRQFIAENFSYEISEIGDETELLESDIIDSTGVMELVFFIADTFGFEADAEDIVPEFRKADAGNESDVADTDDSYFHQIVPPVVPVSIVMGFCAIFMP